MIRFEQLSHGSANKIAKQFDTPLYIIDEVSLLSRFQEFQCLVQSQYLHSKIAVSYKTNPLLYVLSLLHEHGAYAEVVSGEEYQIAKRLKVADNHIIFNGPLKKDQELMVALANGAIINCDHAEEVQRIESLAATMNKQASIGLRVCFDDLGINWNRFGFFRDDSKQSIFAMVEYIKRSSTLNLVGLHAHIGTNIRDIGQFALLAKRLATLSEDMLRYHQVTLKWIDVGGGLAGISPRIDEQQIVPHPLPSLSEYVTAITKPLLHYLETTQATLFFEPGRTLFEPFGGLLTKVVACRPVVNAQSRGLILDAGINALPSAQVYNHPVLHWGGCEQSRQTFLYGPTCNQADQLHQPLQLPALGAGDLLLFLGVGSYSMSFSYSFIRNRPGVITWGAGEHRSWIRRRETIDYVAQLQENQNDVCHHEA